MSQFNMIYVIWKCVNLYKHKKKNTYVTLIYSLKNTLFIYTYILTCVFLYDINFFLFNYFRFWCHVVNPKTNVSILHQKKMCIEGFPYLYTV